MTSNIGKFFMRSLVALTIGSTATAAPAPSHKVNREHNGISVALTGRVGPYHGKADPYVNSYAWMRRDEAGKILTL
jgi:hypothetical protein